MPPNDRKLISIIHEQSEGIEERFDGYRKEIVDLVSDILAFERAHRVSPTNIQKKINAKFDDAAQRLARHRRRDSDTGEPGC